MIVWTESYYAPWDGLIALPVDDGGPAKEAIEHGVIRVVSEADAKATNDKFAKLGPGEAQWLDDLLVARKKKLGMSQ